MPNATKIKVQPPQATAAPAAPKKKRAPKKKVLVSSITFVVDRSGSMATIAKDVIGGFNTFIADQRKLPDPAVVTLTQFDDIYEVVYSKKPINEVADLDRYTYTPRGWTALNDAIGTTLSTIPHDAKGETLVIMTDGEENKSTKYTSAQVKSMVEEFQARGNMVIFLGANIDAFKVGSHYGISASNTSNFASNSIGATASFSGLNSKLASSRSAYSSGVQDWSDAGGTMAANYTKAMDDLTKAGVPMPGSKAVKPTTPTTP